VKLLTPRLELIPATLEIVAADLHRRDELPRLLRAHIAPGWPPPLFDVRAMKFLKQSLIDEPNPGGWTAWYWILRSSRLLVGMSGFKTKPKQGRVELGYSLLPEFHRRGFATEVVGAMVNWAFANGAEIVLAETLPELIASQRVLLKNSFRFVGEGSEPGVIRFERKRELLFADKPGNSLYGARRGEKL
jgi:RimJ/RimL family protein N-acetyltransferase